MSEFFNEVLGSGTDNSFNPLLYLPDINEYLVRNPFKEIKYDLEEFTKENLATLPDMEWLNFVNCELIYPLSDNLEDQKNQLFEFIKKLKSETISIKHGFCPGAFPTDFDEHILALDTETTGLDTRCLYDYDGNLIVKTKLVGFSVASSENYGYYFPVFHTESDGIKNWNFGLIIYFIEALHKEFFILNHNAPYDREILALNGVANFRKWPYFCDTQLLDFFNDSNNKIHNLKSLSEKILGRRMIEIKQLFHFGTKLKKGEDVGFDRIPAKVAYTYACVTEDMEVEVEIEGSEEELNFLGLN